MKRMSLIFDEDTFKQFKKKKALFETNKGKRISWENFLTTLLNK